MDKVAYIQVTHFFTQLMAKWEESLRLRCESDLAKGLGLGFYRKVETIQFNAAEMRALARMIAAAIPFASVDVCVSLDGEESTVKFILTVEYSPDRE